MNPIGKKPHRMHIRELERFQEQARAILTLMPPEGKPPCVVEHDGWRIVIADTLHFPAGYRLREALVLKSDFACGAGCHFEAPIFTEGGFQAGKGSHLHSVSAASDVRLAPDVVVEHHIIGEKAVHLRAGSVVQGEVVAGEAVHLSADACAGTLFAPMIATQGRTEEVAPGPTVSSHIEIGPPHEGTIPDLRLGKLTALGDETWVYDGSLHLPVPLLLRSKLVVRGGFRCAPGSLIEDDVKAGALLHVGAGSICRGHLTSLGDMVLDADCLFQGRLDSRMSLRLRSGTRGFRAGGPVQVIADGGLTLEPNVVVRGSISSGKAVVSEIPKAEGGLELLLAGGF
jgi:hypothetical protein